MHPIDHNLNPTSQIFQIPTLILSAGVADVVEEVLRQHLPGAAASSFVSVISNRMVFDAEGTVVGFEPKGRPIHTFNKGVVSVEGSAHHTIAEGRNNVVSSQNPG